MLVAKSDWKITALNEKETFTPRMKLLVQSFFSYDVY